MGTQGRGARAGREGHPGSGRPVNAARRQRAWGCGRGRLSPARRTDRRKAGCEAEGEDARGRTPMPAGARPEAWTAAVAERRTRNRPAKRGCGAASRRHGRRPGWRPTRLTRGPPAARVAFPTRAPRPCVPMARPNPRCATLAWLVRTARRQNKFYDVAVYGLGDCRQRKPRR